MFFGFLEIFVFLFGLWKVSFVGDLYKILLFVLRFFVVESFFCDDFVIFLLFIECGLVLLGINNFKFFIDLLNFEEWFFWIFDNLFFKFLLVSFVIWCGEIVFVVWWIKFCVELNICFWDDCKFFDSFLNIKLFLVLYLCNLCFNFLIIKFWLFVMLVCECGVFNEVGKCEKFFIFVFEKVLFEVLLL